MTTADIPLHRTNHLDDAGARSVQRRHRAGLLVRVCDGVYVDAPAWGHLDATQQHLVLARAMAPAIRPGAAFSHTTAAVAYGWPIVELAPRAVHVTDPATTRTEHRSNLVRHAGPAETGREAWSFAGVPLTSRLRTARDLATTLDVATAAVAIDSAVRAGTITVADYLAVLPNRPARGSVRSRKIAEALDPLHESVGESYAAVRMVELGFPRPAAQHPLQLRDGTSVRVDFWFADLGLVVEFDGKQKYSDPAMLRGRTPAEAVWEEKRREDRLLALPAVRTVIRPTWWHLVDPERLGELFRQHQVIV